MRLLATASRIVLKALAAISTLLTLVMLGFAAAVLFIGAAGQPLGQVWFQRDPFITWTGSPSIQLFQVFFERKLSLPFLWDPSVVTLLNWPSLLALVVTALGFAALAFVFFALSRSRKS